MDLTAPLDEKVSRVELLSFVPIIKFLRFLIYKIIHQIVREINVFFRTNVLKPLLQPLRLGSNYIEDRGKSLLCLLTAMLGKVLTVHYSTGSFTRRRLPWQSMRLALKEFPP